MLSYWDRLVSNSRMVANIGLFFCLINYEVNEKVCFFYAIMLVVGK